MNESDPSGMCGSWGVLCSVGNVVRNVGLVVSGLLFIFAADLMVTAIIVADAFGLPEDAALLPAETGLLGWVFFGAESTGLGMIYAGLGIRRSKKYLFAPGSRGPGSTVACHYA